MTTSPSGRPEPVAVVTYSYQEQVAIKKICADILASEENGSPAAPGVAALADALLHRIGESQRDELFTAVTSVVDTAIEVEWESFVDWYPENASSIEPKASIDNPEADHHLLDQLIEKAATEKGLDANERSVADTLIYHHISPDHDYVQAIRANTSLHGAHPADTLALKKAADGLSQRPGPGFPAP